MVELSNILVGLSLCIMGFVKKWLIVIKLVIKVNIIIGEVFEDFKICLIYCCVLNLVVVVNVM